MQFFSILGYLIGAAIVVGLFLLIAGLLLWWLVPLAFPAMAFGFWNAIALAAILLLFSTPSLVSN